MWQGTYVCILFSTFAQDNFLIIFVSPETDFATPFFSEQFYQCIEQFVLQLVQY